MQTQHTQELFDKIRRLSPEKVAVVEDFVEFLWHRDEMDTLIKAAGKLSERSFQQVWDNPEDAEYDDL
ncbi:MAG: toxin-antitoxin system, antitoxin component, Xre family protein [Deltaproteobacteria bacterium]|nr:toxin-antitoxin system, antitoxin component, Xre family protein [Deltaproteobacteria bacterium]